MVTSHLHGTRALQVVQESKALLIECIKPDLYFKAVCTRDIAKDNKDCDPPVMCCTALFITRQTGTSGIQWPYVRNKSPAHMQTEQLRGLDTGKGHNAQNCGWESCEGATVMRLFLG